MTPRANADHPGATPLRERGHDMPHGQDAAPCGGAAVGGFSLVEVTLAIGIVAFVVISMVGAMSVGNRTLGLAADNSVQAQITQNLMGSLQQADFSVLTNASPNGWNGRVISFDERGVSTTNPANVIHVATVTIVTPAAVPGSTVNANLARASLAIVKNGNTNETFRTATYVANNGK